PPLPSCNVNGGTANGKGAGMRIVGITLLVVGLAGCGKASLPHEGKSVAQLRRMLDDAQPRVQAQGALGLSLHGPEAREAVPRLTDLLASADSLVRQQAALALGKIGPDARAAVPALEGTLGDADWAVRRQAALALGGIGEGASRKALEKLKRDPNTL